MRSKALSCRSAAINFRNDIARYCAKVLPQQAFVTRRCLLKSYPAHSKSRKGRLVFLRRIANPRLAMADRRGVTVLEYAVFAAAVVGTFMLSADSFVTALAGIIASFTAAL